jgi:hypothetical protein
MTDTEGKRISLRQKANYIVLETQLNHRKVCEWYRYMHMK